MAHPVRPSAGLKRYVKTAGSPPALRAGGPVAHGVQPAAPSAAPIPTPAPAPSAVPVVVPPAPPPVSPRPAWRALTAAPTAAPITVRRDVLVLGGLLVLVLGVVATILLAPGIAHGQDLLCLKPGSVVVDIDAGLAPAPPPSTLAPSPPPPRRPREHATENGWLLTCAILIGVGVGRKSARRESHDTSTPTSPGTESPARPTIRRTLGAHSSVGNTRESNQDRVRAELIDGLDVIVMADGLGGLPHGGEAAEAATAFALRHLQAGLSQAGVASFEGVRTLLLSTIWATASALAREATTRGWTSFDDGFRTTLILVVVMPGWHVAAWIGDGGVFVVREHGDIVSVLEPHKAAATPDLLDASLGPNSDGRPSWAVTPRLPGDVLVVATDGVADVFDATSVPTLRDHLAHAEGDTVRAAEALVAEHAARRDGAGSFSITDNLTVAIATTGGPS